MLNQIPQKTIKTKIKTGREGRKGHNILKSKFSNILAKTYLNLKNEEYFKLTVHEKFLVGTEKNFQGNLNCATDCPTQATLF